MTEKLISDEGLNNVIETLGACQQLDTPFLCSTTYIADLITRLRSAEEALEFYAKKESWQKPSDQFEFDEDDYGLHDMIDNDHEEYKFEGHAGKRARAHFERVGK